ncbi:hypothetical protein A1O7_06356 [Cladophialophora yegresii CBS 114405]|uniref:Alpha-L-rhamnosidase six-hairpin glycosidase domain-containing protein n=1 Tax=Cladophialophora yegresii CBS 114405 TaxID=1182544 RepID=W9W312_9EURO|nr:uncharacterized protein A1O7_06356 [Cladophialophora yegresii CBS 114405]EXJ58926.1 hypothetical protein A1O7_06356 [Cladophialophora yegresii CBS 114405]
MVPILIALLAATVKVVESQCWRDYPCSGPNNAAFPGPWDQNNYAPESRFVSPRWSLLWPNLTSVPYAKAQTISGNGSLVTYDFGKEVGGIVRFSYTSSGAGTLGIAFTESRKFVGYVSDSSNGLFTGSDLWLNVTLTGQPGQYVMPDEVLRGGFRYMTLWFSTNSSATAVSAQNITVELDFQPTWSNLRAYQGYFHCSDELLNRIWYAGAYTLQSNAVPTYTGRQVPMLAWNWANNATLGPGYSIIVDGAKRDRAVWPGDIGIAVPSAFVSTGDLESVRNALQVMYDYQNTTTGAFDESGPPLSQKNSDTYHMWTMIGSYNYVLYTNDTAWLTPIWSKYKHAMEYVVGKIDQSGLMNVTGTRDWARWQQGFHNTEANTILFQTLMTGSKLATWIGDQATATNWSATATALANAINEHTYDASANAYRDNDTTTALHPQDANSMALLFSVAPPAHVPGIASTLVENWTPIGPVTPELPYNISPFISSFELLGRLAVRDTARALELLRTLWGWIVNNADSTESTLLEGYLANGSFAYRSDRGYAYDESYVSHAHGWSSGPTSALTHSVLGLDVRSPAGREWTLAPQTGNLAFAEGGFTTVLGKFSAKWRVQRDGVLLTWDTPVNTSGRIVLPVDGQGSAGTDSPEVTVQLNGEDKTVRVQSSAVSAFGEHLGEIDVPGGKGMVSYPFG